MKKMPLDYAKLACEAIMNRCAARDLPPEGALVYIQGVFLSGMQRVWHMTKEQKYFDYIKEYVDDVIAPDGGLYGVCHELTLPQTKGIAYNRKALTVLDCKQPTILFYDLYDETGDEKYMKAIETIGQSMYFWPVNQYGGYWHMMTQHNQMWLDGAYMAGPLSVKYAKRFGAPVLRERAIHQIFLMADYMKDNKTGLYYHGWDDSKQAEWADPTTGLSGQIWGRAVGWYAVAILDMLDDIPKAHSAVGRLKQIVRDLLIALAKFQDTETGLWFQILDCPDREDNWLESSCSCLFVYAYAKAIRKGILDGEYAAVLEKAYAGIVSMLYYDEDGQLVIDHICTGTSINAGTYEYYIKRPRVKNNLHGVGAFVLMCTEMERYRRDGRCQNIVDELHHRLGD